MTSTPGGRGAWLSGRRRKATLACRPGPGLESCSDRGRCVCMFRSNRTPGLHGSRRPRRGHIFAQLGFHHRRAPWSMRAVAGMKAHGGVVHRVTSEHRHPALTAMKRYAERTGGRERSRPAAWTSRTRPARPGLIRQRARLGPAVVEGEFEVRRPCVAGPCTRCRLRRCRRRTRPCRLADAEEDSFLQRHVTTLPRRITQGARWRRCDPRMNQAP